MLKSCCFYFVERTRSVDITITNLLDGTVKYTPLPQSSKEPKLTVSYSSCEIILCVFSKLFRYLKLLL